MKNKRIILIVIAVVVVCTICALISFKVYRTNPIPNNADRIKCYDEPSTNRSFPELDAKRRAYLTSDRNIYFFETSCFEDDYAKLNCRQACTVESAALMNPHTTVNLLYLSSSPPTNFSAELIKLLKRYNVRENRINVTEYMRGTPLEQWYLDGALSRSNWPNVHMSDILRFIFLWKFGGIYLDLDVIVTTSLENLSNFVGLQSNDAIGSAVLGLTATGLGHEVADRCLRDLMKTYSGDQWADSSVGVLTRVLKNLCGTDNLEAMTVGTCGGFQVFPTSAFFPIQYQNWDRYFTTENSAETMRLIREARAIHVWNKLSASTKMPPDAPYMLTAKEYCPLVYRHCDATF